MVILFFSRKTILIDNKNWPNIVKNNTTYEMTRLSMHLKNKNLQNGNQATYQRSVSLRNFCFVAFLIRVRTRPKLKKSFVILTRTTWVGHISPSFVLQCRSSLFHVLVGTCWRLVWWSAGSGSEAVRQPGRHPQLSAFSSQPPASWPEGGAQAPGTRLHRLVPGLRSPAK